MGADIIRKVLSVSLAATALWATVVAAQQPQNWKPGIEKGILPSDEPMQLDPNVVASLIAWIVTKTGWANAELPQIVFVTKKQLTEMLLERPNAPPEDVHCQALYSRNDEIIYLTKDWRCSDLRDRGNLLHELVHHLQKLNNVKARCIAEFERQAYDLQLEWLREHDVQDPYKFLDIDEFTVRMISQCRE